MLLLLHLSNPGPDAWGDLYAALRVQPGTQHPQQLRDPFIYYFRSAEVQEQGAGWRGCSARGPGTTTASKEGWQPGDGDPVLLAV